MTPRLQPGRSPSLRGVPGASPSLGLLRLLMGVLLLLLGWSSAPSARATSGTIDTPVAGPIIVGAGETLTIAASGSVTTSDALTIGVGVQGGGTLNIEGSSVTPGPGGLGIFLGDGRSGATLNMISGSVHGEPAMLVEPGSTATISGGSLSGSVFVYGGATLNMTASGSVSSGGSYGVGVNGGTLNMTGGSVSGSSYGVIVWNGTAMVSGCRLAVVNGVLTGTLQNGTPINTPVSGSITLVGPTTPPAITLNGSSPMTVDCQIQGSFADPGATASDACGDSFPATASGSVDVNTPGTYTLTYNATDGANAATPVTRTVTVVPVADLSVTPTAPPSTVVTGSTLIYTLVVTNNGPQGALGVALTDPLPAGTSFFSATATAGTLTTPKKGSGGAVTWSMGTGTLGGGNSVTLTVVVKVSAKAGAMLTNTASVSSSSPKDPNLANNSAAVVTAVVAKH